MNYSDWLTGVPETFRTDPLWKVEAYRLAMFAADVGWEDVTKLVKDFRTRELASQLYDSLGSIGANIAEGYSRISGRDQARFYEYALGSARESRSRYFNARHLLGDTVAVHRCTLLSSVAKLLLVMIPDHRSSALREDVTAYMAVASDHCENLSAILATPAPFA